MPRESLFTRAENGAEEELQNRWVDIPRHHAWLAVEHGTRYVAHAAGDATRAGKLPVTESGEDVEPELVREVFKKSHLRGGDG